MSDHCPPTAPSTVSRRRTRRIFIGLAVLTLIRAAGSMAADQASNPVASPTREEDRSPPPVSVPFAPPSFSGRLTESIPDPVLATVRPDGTGLPAEWSIVPRDYAPPPAADLRAFSSKDFRPRGHSVFDADPAITNANDSLMVDKTVWQRLQEYRNRDRVRVLTLWESGASAVSIQTNRKGDPSLQWTSRLMNRGGATRGLLDRWMPSTMFRGFSHPAGAPSGKAANALAGAHPGMSAIP